MKFSFLWLVLGSVTAFSNPSGLRPYLSDESIREIRNILKAPKSSTNLEQAEQRYHQIVNRQILSDLSALYAPENEPFVSVTYPNFIPHDSPRPGDDLGYGFHVVRRLALPIAGGGTKVVDVNEAWSENLREHGLFLPDEIRVKTLIYEGPRFVEGSHELYLYDTIRIAWNVRGEPEKLFRRSRYQWDAVNEKNRAKRARISVSSPYSCTGCHTATSDFAEAFRAEGETRNFEAIVQNSFFLKPLSETIGWKKYLQHLGEKGVVNEFVEGVTQTLSDPKHRMNLSSLSSFFLSLSLQHELQWLNEDSLISAEKVSTYQRRQGVWFHKSSGNWFLDALEGLWSGKYETWQPVTRVPSLE